VTDENKLAFDACLNLESGKSLSLVGNVGTGKTHIAIAALKNFPMQAVTGKDAEQNKALVKFDLKDMVEGEARIKLEKWLQEEMYRYRKAKCLFIPAVEMFLKLNDAVANGKSKIEILDNIDKYDCICLDDLGSEKLTEAKQENLYVLIDRRYRSEKSLIVTSNFSIEEISELEPRIASRLTEMGRIFHFNGSDFRINN